MNDARPAAILDIDGTLVDTNYHHAVAWFRAFQSQGAVLPLYKIHRHMGMGGDNLVGEVAGEDFEREHGEAVRADEKERYAALIDEVAPLADARRLLEVLKDRGHTIVLASSAKAEEVEHYLDLLDARELADAWTTSADVQETKPAPDLITSALEKAGGGRAVMVGDSTWDCIAAEKAGIQTIGVLTGGFSEKELREGGAVEVFETLAELIDALDRTPLG
jgi:HAD superfamily hydrolase (TIGR01549 family)